MAHAILKPLSDDELKVRVGEFIDSFISLNKKNQASLEELKESYHDADLMLYHILKGSNGIVDSARLLDILQKPEAMTTSGRSEVQNYKPHDDRYLQPVRGGHLTPAESGQSHRFMYNYSFTKLTGTNRYKSV